MKKILIISFLFLLLGPGQVQAAGLVPCGPGIGNPGDQGYNPQLDYTPCQFCHFFVLINDLIKFVLFKIAPTIAVLMLVIGGVLFFLAGAKPAHVEQAKGIITSVVIGLLIIFSAWVIVNTILTKAGIVRSSSLLNWYQISCAVR